MSLSSLAAGSPLPNISSTTTAVTTAPDWYNTAMQNIASNENLALNATPSAMIAPQSSLQISAQNLAPTLAVAYQTPLSTAESTAQQVQGGLTPSQVTALMNPYVSNVIDQNTNLSNANTINNILPLLNAQAAATGQSGSMRDVYAQGQTLGDIQASLNAQNAGLLNTEYNTAVTNALANNQNINQVASTQGTLANLEGSNATTALNNLENIGGLQQAYQQSILSEPQTAAANAATAVGALKVPGTTSTTYLGPGQSGQYSTSPLGVVTGLGGLFASGANGSGNAAQNFISMLPSMGSIENFLGFGSSNS
jgi:hypothetical protein